MNLTTQDEEKLIRLAQHEGWQVISRVLDLWAKEQAQRLASHRFQDMLDVGRHQGKMMAYEQVKAFVNRRLERAMKGD